ncbi:MAG TPA: zinc-ribbon domain-containing protein [bacterium]|nr:zinc-ribbon domain-containing protein [bacterium]
MKKIFVCSIILLYSISIEAYHFNYISTNIGIRSSGLGGAYTSVKDDLNYNYANPAGIDFENIFTISSAYKFPKNVKSRYNFDIETKKEKEIEIISLSYTYKKINFGFLYSPIYDFNINYGSMQRRNNLGEDMGTFTASERTKITKKSIPIRYQLSNKIIFGLEISMLELTNKNMISQYYASGSDKIYNFGAGILFKPDLKNNIGFSIFNKSKFNYKLVFISQPDYQKDELPLNINFGYSRQSYFSDNLTYLISFDLSYEKWSNDYQNNNIINFKQGNELKIRSGNIINKFRIGFYTKNSPSKFDAVIYDDRMKETLIQFSLGYGLELKLNDKNNLFLDLSYEDNLNNALNKEKTFKVGLGYNFGNIKLYNINDDKKEKVQNIKQEISNSEKINKSDFIYCHNCGFKLLLNSKFCSKCGAKIIE